MTHYRTGRDFENRVRVALELEGYGVVRAGGSKGAADLVALKLGQTLLIQAKKTNGQLPPGERVALFDLATRCGALPIVAHQPVPRRPIVYRLLTGTDPSQWVPFVPDEVEANA